MKSTQKRNMGFSMIELLISLSILIILTGITTGAVLRHRTKTQEKSYMVEAVSVFDALNLVVTDRVEDGTFDGYTFWEDFANKSTRDILLEPYLSGKRTKGSEIFSMGLDENNPGLYRLEYKVAGYKILVEKNRSITIIERPD